MNLTDIYRIFHPAAAQYIFFSAAHRTFSKIGHILGHKASLNKYKKTEITPCILSDHNGIKIEHKKLLKIFEHRQTEQYIGETHQRNKGDIKNVPRIQWK
jgi:hypothetical protein